MIVFMGLSLCWPLPPRHYFKPARHGLADAEGRTLTMSNYYVHRSPVSRGRLKKWGNKYIIPKN